MAPNIAPSHGGSVIFTPLNKQTNQSHRPKMTLFTQYSHHQQLHSNTFCPVNSLRYIKVYRLEQSFVEQVGSFPVGIEDSSYRCTSVGLADTTASGCADLGHLVSSRPGTKMLLFLLIILSQNIRQSLGR